MRTGTPDHDEPCGAATAPTAPDGGCGHGFTALNPVDGLFLRAQHLATMQDYSRAISAAVGRAAGSGVVHGLRVEVDESAGRLSVSPGLALNGQGTPLLSTTVIEVALPDATGAGNPGDAYWVVRVCPGGRLTGRENRYGSLCDDTCGATGATVQPFRDEGLCVELLPASLPSLGTHAPARRRNVLASAWFESEREQGGPWLTRGTEDRPQQHRLARDWADGTDEQPTECVAIALLLQVEDRWVVDTWAARRTVGATGADDTWRYRLGMRPWNVFTAQVLQFQDQLAPDVTEIAAVRLHDEAVVDEGEPVLAEILEEALSAGGVQARLAQRIQSRYLESRRAFVRLDSSRSLRQRGFDELPPAGFLPRPATVEELRERLRVLFDDAVDWRLCSASADAVARAVEDARNLDRIPLTEGENRPQVDVLVPDVPADLPFLTTTYDWVAFVRHREIDCGSAVPPDEVPVVVVERREFPAFDAAVRRGADAEIAKAWTEVAWREHVVGTLEYPHDTWEYPGGEVSLRLADIGDRALAVVALTRSADARPLGAIRAHLLAASWVRQEAHLPVVAVAVAGLPADVLVVLTGPPREEMLRAAAAEDVVRPDVAAGRAPAPAAAAPGAVEAAVGAPGGDPPAAGRGGAAGEDEAGAPAADAGGGGDGDGGAPSGKRSGRRSNRAPRPAS